MYFVYLPRYMICDQIVPKGFNIKLKRTSLMTVQFTICHPSSLQHPLVLLSRKSVAQKCARTEDSVKKSQPTLHMSPCTLFTFTTHWFVPGSQYQVCMLFKFEILFTGHCFFTSSFFASCSKVIMKTLFSECLAVTRQTWLMQDVNPHQKLALMSSEQEFVHMQVSGKSFVSCVRKLCSGRCM